MDRFLDMVDWGSVQRPPAWEASEGAFDDAEEDDDENEPNLTFQLDTLHLEKH